MLPFPRLFDLISLYRSATLSFSSTYSRLTMINNVIRPLSNASLSTKVPFSPTESANSATTTLPAIVTVTNAFGTILTGTATPITNVPSLRTATLFNSAWHGHTVTVMHTLGSIPMVTPVLNAEDAFIGLSGLDVEPKSDETLFALFVIPGLPVFSLLNDGTPILLEDSVQRMRLENTQTPNTPWEPCAQWSARRAVKSIRRLLADQWQSMIFVGF